MKTEVRLRDLSFRLIQVLVWFEVLWACVFLVAMVFQWTGLTDQLSTAFFGSGACALLVLAALTLLNVTANLNIISIAEVRKVSPALAVEEARRTWTKTLAAAGALIAIVVVSLWAAEWRLHRAKVAEAETKVESIADSPLVGEAIELVASNGRAQELEKVRDALSASIQSGARLSFLFPRTVKGVTLYYELTAWWVGAKNEGTTIGDASLTRFVPSSAEREPWTRLVGGQISVFAVPAERELRVFRRVKNERGELILLLDTSRRSDYARSSL